MWMGACFRTRVRASENELHDRMSVDFPCRLVGERDCVLFIGTQFSNLYTAVGTPAEAS
jgi:hypothetical protein